MRTKTLALTAILGVASIAAALAQSTPVYSVNVVGFVKLSLPKGFSMIANPLNAATNDLNTIIPTAPDGSSIMKWEGAKFGSPDTYYEGMGWLDSDLNPSKTTLNPGEGAFIQLPSATEVVFVGEVPQGTLTREIPKGFSIVSQLTPQKISLDDASFPARMAIRSCFGIMQRVNTQLRIHILKVWDGWMQILIQVAITPEIGQSFFVQKTVGKTWTRTFTVQ